MLQSNGYNSKTRGDGAATLCQPPNMSGHGSTWLGGKNSPREMQAYAGTDMLVESSGTINNVRYSIVNMEWQSGEACRAWEMNQKYMGCGSQSHEEF